MSLSGKVGVVGKHGHFYVLKFSYLGLDYICAEGPCSFKGALFVVHRWLPKMAFLYFVLAAYDFSVQFYGNPLDFDVPDSFMLIMLENHGGKILLSHIWNGW